MCAAARMSAVRYLRTLMISLVVGASLLPWAGYAAGDTDLWQALFAAVPAPPSIAEDALTRIAARRIGDRFAVEATDPVLRNLQRDVDALFEPASNAAAALMKQRLREIEADPQIRRWAQQLDAAAQTESAEAPTREQLQAMHARTAQIMRELEPAQHGQVSGGAVAASTAEPGSEIAAYRLQLQRAEPRAGSFYQRAFELRRRYAQLHAELDREALQRVPAEREGARTLAFRRQLVEQHLNLARRQLEEAAVLFADARASLHPRFEHMAALARDAEQRAATAGERIQAYSAFKSYVELLLAIDRLTIEDVGFWAAVRPRQQAPDVSADSRRDPYEFSLLPDIDLQVWKESAPNVAPYPPGRLLLPTALSGTR